MKKTFVIDTNVLIHNPDSLTSFADNSVVLPITVIEELDKLKSFSDERGRNARIVARFLDNLRSGGKLSEGVPLGNGGVLRIELNCEAELPAEMNKTKSDNRILMAALRLQRKGEKVFFITKDINARIKADALGIEARDFEKQKVNIEELYSGWAEIPVNTEEINTFISQKGLILKDFNLYDNQFVLLKDKEHAERSSLGKYIKRFNKILPLYHQKEPIWGIRPLNMQQQFAMDLLLTEEIKLVTLVGTAGTGKTLLAIAAGLQKTINEDAYKKILVSRPIIPLGKDIGYLPGDKEAKLSHWMQPIFDNLEFLIDCNKRKQISYEELIESKRIELEAVTFIRGRTLPKQFFIIDEAQNLTPHEVKTIISRAGEDTKVILTGDPYQIDNPYLDANSNGLTYVAERFKGEEIFGHVTLEKSERSYLSSLAVKLL
ncbi:MAG: PhoH family protein [Candidatus Firestonebacteria bacterium]|nr:PhoH family protein [Candidatus Firestonebacteria bacterium]